jgi:hypothetical protein
VTRHRYNIAALILYAVGSLLVCLHHEPWRDEADTWLMARDNNVVQLVGMMGYSGTPCAWHLLQMPPAKAGMPFVTQRLMNTTICIAAVAVLLFAAPFATHARVLIALSFFPAYEYGIVARSYGLTMLLLFVAMACYPHRARRPWAYGLCIALLANTNAHGFCIAGLLGALWLIDARRQRKAAPALLLAVAGGFAAFMQMLPPPDGQLKPLEMGINWSQLLAAAGSMVAPVNMFNSRFAIWASLVVNIAVLVAVASMLRRAPRAIALLAGAALALGGLALMVYYGGSRHAGMVGLAMVAACWMAKCDGTLRPNRIAHGVIVAALAVSCMLTAWVWHLEWRYAFSAAREMSSYIRSHDYDDYTIAAFPDPVTSSVLPDLHQRTFWYAGLQHDASHMPWNRSMSANRNIEPGEAMRRIETAFPQREKVLVLLNVRIIQPERVGYRLVYATQSRVFRHPDERYWLYQWVGRPRWFTPAAVSPAPRAGER